MSYRVHQYHRAMLVVLSVACIVAGSFSPAHPQERSGARQCLARANDLLLKSAYDSAAFYFRKACALSQADSDLAGQLSSLNGLAESFVRKGRIPESAGILKEAHELGVRAFADSTLDCAKTHYFAAYADAYLDNPTSSIANGRTALRIRQRLLGADHLLVAECFYVLGLGYEKKGEYPPALENFRSAYAMQRTKLGDDNSITIISKMATGRIFSAVCRNDSAIACLQQSLESLGKLGLAKSTLAVDCHAYLTTAFTESGELPRALESAKLALSLSRGTRGEKDPTTAACYGKLGEVYVDAGDYQRGIEFLQKGLAIVLSLQGQMHSGAAWSYRFLSKAYAGEGALAKAAEYAQMALRIQRATLGKYHPDVAYSLENAAAIEMQRGDPRRATSYLNEAIRIRERTEGASPQIDIARMYLSLGETYLDRKDNAKAFVSLSKATTIENRSPGQNRSLRAATERTLGNLLERKGELTAALRSYQRSFSALCPGYADTSIYATPSGNTSVDPNELVATLLAQSRALQEVSGRNNTDVRSLESALSALRLASNVISRVRTTYVAERSKLSLSSNVAALSEEGVRTSLRLFEITGEERYKATALAFAERSKASVLLDGIRDAKAKKFAGIPDSVLDRERDLVAGITFCKAQIHNLSDAAGLEDSLRMSRLEDRLFALTQQYNEQIDGYSSTYPDYYSLRFNKKSVDLKAIQAALDPGSRLVEYFVGSRSIYIFTIGKDGLEVIKGPLPSGFRALARAFTESIRTMDLKGYLQSGGSLFDITVRPIARYISGNHRLIIIPDGTLYYVPFEALLAPGPQEKENNSGRVDFTTLPYLVRQYDISYSFSAAFYVMSRTAGPEVRSGQRDFAGFAPVFRDSERNGYLLASNRSSIERGFGSLRSVSVDGKRFDELPYSEEEVKSIVADFTSRGNRGVGFFNGNATEGNFKRNAAGYSYLHIATHACINDDHPSLSALLFSQPSDSTSKEDGVLYAGETYSLKLNADLLVLSSCESGVGRVVQGEGAMAMTRGFFYAGAKNIVFTLWKVYDDVSSRLMEQFYRGMLDGRSYASALRAAKLKMIQNPSTAFPSKWAGFVLLGE